MLETLQEKNLLYAKLSNCELWLREVSLLGHVISSGGKEVDLSKVKVVLQWGTPKLITEVICFLGLVGYYRMFI